MKKNYQQPILFIAVLTLTIAVLWVYLSVYRVFTKKQPPIAQPREIQILNPILDSAVFEELQKRKI